jgi:hypothetical protein
VIRRYFFNESRTKIEKVNKKKNVCPIEHRKIMYVNVAAQMACMLLCNTPGAPVLEFTA